VEAKDFGPDWEVVEKLRVAVDQFVEPAKPTL
jgi:hypothetical protein